MRSFTMRALMLAVALGGTAATTDAAKRAPTTITVTDARGVVIRFDRIPRRIVSLDPRDTETLFAVGAEQRVVADGSYEGAQGFDRAFRYPSQWPSPWGKNYPTLARTLPHITGGCCGTHFDVETITRLRPDLIVAPYSKTELSTFDQLTSLGMKVLVLDPSSIQGIMRDITLLGKVTGNSRKARKVVATMKAQLAALAARLQRVRSRPRVYYEIDATNPAQPFTAGPGTFVARAISLAGGRNVGNAATGCSGTLCYPQFSLEALVRLDPQVIVLGDASYGTSPADVRARPGWSTIRAVRTGRIYPFNDELLTRAGPRIVVGIRAMARLLHPTLGKES